MKRKYILTAIILTVVTGLSACQQNTTEFRSNTIITAASADFDYLNPLLIQLSLSREVCTLIYPSLVKPTYNEKSGNITFIPSAATSWKFSPDGRNVTFHLKKRGTNGKTANRSAPMTSNTPTPSTPLQQ